MLISLSGNNNSIIYLCIILASLPNEVKVTYCLPEARQKKAGINPDHVSAIAGTQIIRFIVSNETFYE